MISPQRSQIINEESTLLSRHSLIKHYLSVPSSLKKDSGDQPANQFQRCPDKPKGSAPDYALPLQKISNREVSQAILGDQF